MTTQGRKLAIKLSKTVFSINSIVIKNYDLTKLLSLKHIKIGSAFKGEPKKLSTCTYDKIYIHNDLIKSPDVKVPTKVSELTNDAEYVKKTDLDNYYVKGSNLSIGNALYDNVYISLNKGEAVASITLRNNNTTQDVGYITAD